MADKWIKKRHKILQKMAIVFVGPVMRIRYGIKVDKFPDRKGQYLVLLNHQTVGDQFFVPMAMAQTHYFMATEDIFSNGFISKLLRFSTAPIPIKKSTTDLKAVMTAIRVAKEGGTIDIAPEGNRTYSGRTAFIKSSIAPLIKKLGLPVAIFRVEGGYGSQPRWSNGIRKGPIKAGVRRVISSDEYSKLTNDELTELIRQELYVDETKIEGRYVSKKKAEYMERLVYICPECGFSKFHSEGDIVECCTCHRKIRYHEDKTLEGIDKEFPFKTVTDWYDYQCNYINHLDITTFTDKSVFTDTVRLSEVILYKKKNLLRKTAGIELYGDRVVIDSGSPNEMILDYNDVSAMSVLGRNKLNIYYKDMVYQFKGAKEFNAIKYMNFYYRNRNIVKGDTNAEFLGI